MNNLTNVLLAVIAAELAYIAVQATKIANNTTDTSDGSRRDPNKPPSV